MLDKIGNFLGNFGQDMLSSAIGIGHANYSAAKQRHFARSMDNTRYQRAANDLDAAGLNRIIALGSPGSAGSSSAPVAPGPQFGATGLRSAQAASAKQAVLQSQAQTDAIEVQNELLRAQIKKTEAETRVVGANASQAEFMKMFFELLGPQFRDLMKKGVDYFGANPSDVKEWDLDKFFNDIAEGAKHRFKYPLGGLGYNLFKGLQGNYGKESSEPKSRSRYNQRRN